MSLFQRVLVFGYLRVPSKAFWLFLAVRHPVTAQSATGLTAPQNRYLPGLEIVWIYMVMFGNISNVSKCCPRFRRGAVLKGPPVDVSLSPHSRSPAHLVTCKLPLRIVGGHIPMSCHLYHSNDDRNEVRTSSSDWSEFALRSDWWTGLGCMP